MDTESIIIWMESNLTFKEFWVPLAQSLAPFLAAWMMLIQINRNHRNNIVLQTEKIKDDFKNKLYAEINERLEIADDAAITAAGYVNKIALSFTSYLTSIELGHNPLLPKERIPEVINLQYQGSNAITKLIYVIEKYEIVQPELKIFQKALNVCMHDISAAFTPFFQESLLILPITIEENINGRVEKRDIPKPFPTRERFENFKKLGFNYQKAWNNITGVTYDFRIEIQNLLLGNIFGRKVPSRQPIDPNIKVIATDPENIQKLNQYFDEETAWGKYAADIKKQVRESLNQINKKTGT
jgi:hypothetical protein